MSRMLTVCGMVAILAMGCMAYPGGAPASVCNDPEMEPTLHTQVYNATGVNNTNQYTLNVQPVDATSGRVKVTLSGAGFMGFVVRASTPGEKNLGEFLAAESDVAFHTMDCSVEEYVGVTHTNADLKSSVTLVWQDKNEGNYNFQATVVKDIENYVKNIVPN